MTAQRVTALPPMDGESIASCKRHAPRRSWIANADLDIPDESQSPRKSVKDGRPLRMAVSNTPSTLGRVASSSRAQPGIRDYKTPQGPRPPEFASKRYYNVAVAHIVDG